MNPCHDNIIYCGRAGRRALWRAIMDDITNDIIEACGNIEEIKNIILYGDPIDVNEGITYTYILQLEEVK